MTAAQRAALQAAMQLPFPSFPCLPNKRPACPHGFKDATTADAELATVWSRHPGELIGVPTGTASGLAVLDIDPRNGGRVWWETNRSRLPQTRTHRTRSGGLHALFRHRPGLRNSAGRIAPGVDVRAEGGYVIWWPAAGFQVKDAPLPDWPDWLKPKAVKPRLEPDRRILNAGSSLDAAVKGIARRVERAVEGERNSVTFWAGCRIAELVRDGKLELGWGMDLLHLVAGRAGLPSDEAHRAVDSAFRRVLT